MVDGSRYFFKPRIGGRYADGFKGMRTLIVGAHHICYANRIGDCPLREQCSSSVGIRGIECPLYKGREDYYRLANSNEIEIQSYIDNDTGYPAYSAFAHYMLGIRDRLSAEQREAFWEQVAFTNYLQHFRQDDDTPDYKGNKALYETDYEAFKEVLDELEPELVMVWNPAVKECIQVHGDLRYIGVADMQSISVYVFVNHGDAKAAHMRKIRYGYGITSPKHNAAWYRKLARDAFRSWVKIDEDMRRQLNNLAEALKQMVDDGIIFAVEEFLCFGEDVTTSHKAMLRDQLKRHINISQGITPALAHIFNDENIGKYTVVKAPSKNDRTLANMMAAIESHLKIGRS